MDHRAVFFLGAAGTSLAVAPLAPADFRWVAVWLAVLYVVLAAASYLDFRGQR